MIPVLIVEHPVTYLHSWIQVLVSADSSTVQLDICVQRRSDTVLFGTISMSSAGVFRWHERQAFTAKVPIFIVTNRVIGQFSGLLTLE